MHGKSPEVSTARDRMARVLGRAGCGWLLSGCGASVGPPPDGGIPRGLLLEARPVDPTGVVLVRRGLRLSVSDLFPRLG